MKRNGFTLIELLVAISIIAILAALMTPAIGGAIERGRSSKCVGNLRQIGAAMQQYISDNDYRFPAIETEPPSLPPDVESSGTALEVLSPYGITMATLTCPTDAVTTRNVEKHKTSYHFSPVLQDESPVSVKIYGRRGIFEVSNIGRLTMATDYEPVHNSGGGIGFNVLKADGRVTQR
ncbi:MAG: prepilin-type N-terminal cleavage/methylation domain-containing protein [Chthoniobacterales bacterium]|nr:prepilin-type N-terminal cleavage/methylation domain-containing protein [Chthoniobacterales bacterium]